MAQTDPERAGKWGAPLPGAPKVRSRASKLHEQRMARIENGQRGVKPLVTRGEAEVVPAEPLGEILRAWVVKWLAERPRAFSKYDKKAIHHVGPINWLAQETGIHVSRVEQIVNGKHPHVPVSQADKLLLAIGEQYRLGAEIRVKPNPNWSFEKWQEYMAERGCV